MHTYVIISFVVFIISLLTLMITTIRSYIKIKKKLTIIKSSYEQKKKS